MRIICAPDKFKQCCTAGEAAKALADGVRSVLPDAELIELPVADGGEGTLDALHAQFPERRTVTVQDALGREVEGEFALDGKRALIESAQACGLWRLEEFELDPNRAHTCGVGQLIKHALDAGAGEIMVGLGGSATSDGGTGMARALGAKFLGDDGNEIETVGGNLKDIRKVDLSGVDERLKSIKLTALCDVMTPMLGPEGASRKFVVQKGGTTRTMHKLEEGLATLELHAREAGANGGGLESGTGAAGGLGYGVRALLGGELLPGAKTVLGLIDFPGTLKGAGLVLTGEGSYDPQTADGKLITVLASHCKAAGVPLVVLAGAVSHEVDIEGVTAAFGISTYGTRKQDALNAGLSNLARHAAAVVRLMNNRR